MIFWFKTLRDSKVRAAKDHGKKFRSRIVSSFSGIVHCKQEIAVEAVYELQRKWPKYGCGEIPDKHFQVEKNNFC